MRILVVEDEPKLAELLGRGLREEGHAVDLAPDGETASWMAQATDYDVLVLDITLPGMSGLDLCRELRARDVRTPVLFLTALDATVDRVAGLDVGGDDYLTKPFVFEELLARLRALTRRGPLLHDVALTVGPLRLDPAARTVTRDATQLEIAGKEFAILEKLMRCAGMVVTRFAIVEHAWDGEVEHRSNVLDVYLRNLRSHVDRPWGSHAIETVRGIGYRLRTDEVAWRATH